MCRSRDWLWQNINYQLRLEAECHPTCLYHFWFRLRDLCVHCMCRHVVYLFWTLLSWCPQPHTLQGKRNILLNSWLMLIKLSRCICICSGNCCRMFCTAHSLSCASNTCCCKTSRPRSDISSEALRSIAVMPCVPICQLAAPHLTDILCLLILAWSTLACGQGIKAYVSIGPHSFLLATLLLGLLCCEWQSVNASEKAPVIQGAVALWWWVVHPYAAPTLPKASMWAPSRVGTFSCTVMSSSEHWQCIGWKRPCLRATYGSSGVVGMDLIHGTRTSISQTISSSDDWCSVLPVLVTSG